MKKEYIMFEYYPLVDYSNENKIDLLNLLREGFKIISSTPVSKNTGYNSGKIEQMIVYILESSKKSN